MKEKKRGLLTGFLRKMLNKSRNDDETLASLAIASKELDDDDLFFVAGGAQYEATDSALKNLIGIESGLSEQTQAAIMSLLNESPVSTTENLGDASVNTTDNVLVLQDTNFSDATFTKVETAVFDEGASGQVNLTSDKNITTEIVNSDGLAVNTGNGDNTVTIDGGQASVNTGAGEDQFFFKGDVKGEFTSGNGDDGFALDPDAQKNAEISVDAGDGFDLMRLFGDAIKHRFEFSGGKFDMK